MKRRVLMALKQLVSRVQTRIGQRANRSIGGLVYTPSDQASIRMARRSHQLLWRLGYQAHSYKTCLLTEAQCLRAEASYGPPNPAWAGVNMPIARLMVFQWRRNLKVPLRAVLQPLRRHRLRLRSESLANKAGLFEGMGYRFRTTADGRGSDLQAYARLSHQAEAVLSTYRSIHPANHGKGTIGILISCFNPEEYITGFLNNLRSLETQNRLVPVIINAGMSAACAETIQTQLSQASFRDYHFLNHHGSGIYEAWNHGIKALGDSVEFITNFNVDDRRHPLCLNVQAECLNAFPNKQVAITDYTYFFETNPSVSELFALNSLNRTLIPTVNQRTLVDKNFPHASPMWRRKLHHSDQCGLFDTSYRSAGDAEFWYRVSRRYPHAFAVISIPLSLYYQNPSGLSTRPQTEGVSEHRRCTEDHYQHLMALMDAKISPEFAQRHIQLSSLEHMQIHALASCLREA